jgi:uncharacterized protein (DUF433 family)
MTARYQASATSRALSGTQRRLARVDGASRAAVTARPQAPMTDGAQADLTWRALSGTHHHEPDGVPRDRKRSLAPSPPDRRPGGPPTRPAACLGVDSGAWLAQRSGIPLASMTRLDRITTDPSICHGKPTVRGLRYPVQMLLELLASGMTIEEILEDYPDLERDDMLAALEFGAKTAGMRRVPLGAA